MKEKQGDAMPVTGIPLRILVVDDNRDAGETLTQLLEASGFAVRYVEDAPAAVAEARNFAPDLAVLDIGLPTTDGYQLAKQLRSLPEGSALGLIALSGYGDDQDERKSAEAGFSVHMTKPVRIGELVAAINTIINNGGRLTCGS